MTVRHREPRTATSTFTQLLSPDPINLRSGIYISSELCRALGRFVSTSSWFVPSACVCVCVCVRARARLCSDYSCPEVTGG